MLDPSINRLGIPCQEVEGRQYRKLKEEFAAHEFSLLEGASRVEGHAIPDKALVCWNRDKKETTKGDIKDDDVGSR